MKAIISLVISLVILNVPLSVYAHEGEAHVELNVTQAQPGMSIEVHGSGFEPGDAATIMLMLVSTDRPQVLGSAIADANGDLIQMVELPKDVMGGAYEVQVVDTHHVATAALDIVVDANDEEGSQRGEEEPLLASVPTQPARPAPAQPVSAPLAIPTSAETAPTIPPTLLLSSSLAVVILVVGLVVIVRRSR